MRGLAVLVMIQCHTFNSFVRTDLRDGGPYMLSQFIGGMAAPLFLFMAGMTFAFQMDSLDRREPSALRRWLAALRRGAYILAIAFAFRLSNWAFSLGHADLHEITKVDILNGMGLGMMVLAVAAVFGWKGRTRFAVAAGVGIAAAAPVIAALSWDGVPTLLYDYLVPAPGQGRFPFFPFAAYVAYGLAAGAIVKQTSGDRLERLMQWTVLIGLVLALGGEYAGNMSYSVYTKSDFWSNSPALILIRCGITLLLLAGSYLWTEYCAGPGWSWMITLGKNSLMVYWVHVVLVYGDILKPAKHALSIGQTVTATLTVIVLMVGLSSAWLRWKHRRAERLRQTDRHQSLTVAAR
jgi:uncharacterized membrane protein